MFQREFVWDDTQRLELLDSVARERPIGALFLWITQRSFSTYDMLGPVRVLQRDSNPPYPEYLVDGLQRVTTLYAALAPGLLPSLLRDERSTALAICLAQGRRSAKRRPRTGAQQQWEIFLDADADEGEDRFKLRTGRMLKSGRVPPSWVSLWRLFNPDSIRATEETDGFKENALWRGRLRGLVDVFVDAPIVLIPMVTESEEDAVGAFTRINRGGTPMDETALVHAKTWQRTKGEVNLLRRLASLRDRLAAYGYDDLKDGVFLNALILSGGGTIQSLKQRDEERVAAMLGGAGREGLEQAERFLRACDQLPPRPLVCERVGNAALQLAPAIPRFRGGTA